jgi:hypothetical protein
MKLAWPIPRWCLLTVLLLAGSLFAQQLSQRLVLKDGTYQAVSKYEVKGERVRYLSAERGEWEELPASLVDWDATRKFNEGRAKAEPSQEARELDKEAAAELKAEEARSPAVAKGLNLPPEGGVFLLDMFNGQPQLIELNQNGGELNRNTAANILRGAINPIASSKQSIELQGSHAAVQSHLVRPVIYLNSQPETDTKVSQQPQQPQQAQQPLDQQNFRIVRADIKKDARVVGNIKIAVYGKVSQQQKFVEIIAEPLSGGWVKLTPVADLPPGEYAIVEMLGRQGMNLNVWDFGVNPKAPSNSSVWKPVPAKETTKPEAKP